ncbi:low affinity immunoglobulin epsilon Fc receptor-like [Lytechinus variegatus]|uniref:low affinity immunoglobulin epsilon Fc receptor-like n=1 Tax=Lytechinus variegatus TaxID=7654 RepID=UPI001BB16964|nr:low affinity immunoglobulin epsilon Fc receptor-like [Lytechinus variegatus]
MPRTVKYNVDDKRSYGRPGNKSIPVKRKHCNTVCPEGWVYGKTKCFLFENNLKDLQWTTARDTCNALEAVTLGNGKTAEPSLFVMEGIEEVHLLKRNVITKFAWVNCIRIDKTFECYTDRAGTTTDYRNWEYDQPNLRQGEIYAMVYMSNGKMHDHFNYRDSTATVCQVNVH